MENAQIEQLEKSHALLMRGLSTIKNIKQREQIKRKLENIQDKIDEIMGDKK